VLLLALDTCDAQGSIAVLRNTDVLQGVAHETSDDYSSWLLPAVGAVLEAAGVALSHVDAYAVAAGPGSFTGVRVGLATVKAWAEVYGRPIVAVSRLEALATQASGTPPYVAAFTNAQRGQVFGAMYRRRGHVLERVEEEIVIAPERFVACAVQTAGGDRVHWISTDPKCLTEAQPWAARRDLGETVEATQPNLAPAIGRLGHQLALAGRLTDPLSLDANYVRRSDAEILWKGSRPAGNDRHRA
jgi:tRNA threonylcarbamoyladenosine biosynthesis protein TsaB